MTILELVRSYLSGELDVPVVTEVPEDMPEEFISIEKTGGGEDNYIYESVFAIQSWAQSMARADELNDIVKNEMRNIIVLDQISKCKLNTDYNYPDKNTKRPRYQAVYEINHY